MATQTVRKLMTFPVGLYELTDLRAKSLGLPFQDFIKYLLTREAEETVEEVEMLDEDTEERVGKALEDYREGRTATVRNKKELKEFMNSMSPNK